MRNFRENTNDAMAGEPIKVAVQILNRSYPVTVRPEEEELVREAGKNIHERVSKLQRAYNIDQPQDLLAMVAIQLATRVAQLTRERQEEHKAIEDYSERFQLLIGDKLEKTE
jgi:cell division protein ZapA